MKRRDFLKGVGKVLAGLSIFGKKSEAKDVLTPKAKECTKKPYHNWKHLTEEDLVKIIESCDKYQVVKYPNIDRKSEEVLLARHSINKGAVSAFDIPFPDKYFWITKAERVGDKKLYWGIILQ